MNGEESTSDSEEERYLQSIFLTTKENQMKLELSGALPPPEFMESQPHINENMRSNLVDWLITLVKFLELKIESYFKCINILDAYIARTVDVKISNLVLIGVASLSLAAKYNEIYAPELESYIYIINNVFSWKEIMAEETKIFITLGCDIGLVPVDIEYYRYISTNSKASLESHNMGKYLLTIAKIEVQNFLPSVYATAVWKIISHIFQQNYINSYEIIEIVVDACMKEIIDRCKRLNQSIVVSYKKVATPTDKKLWLQTFNRVCSLQLDNSEVKRKNFMPYKRVTYYKEKLKFKLLHKIDIPKLQTHIGEGSYSIVKSVEYKDKLYAVKKINKKHISSFLLREISLGLSLNHPNVAKIRYISKNLEMIFFDLGVSDLNNWIIKNGQLDTKLQKILAIQMFEALSYIHSMGCMHRDIKPANIIVYGTIKKPFFVLSDFGLARGPGIVIKNDAWTHEVITFRYRPPEIFLGYKKYNEKVDVWSMLCVLFETACKPLSMRLGMITPLFPGFTELETLDLIFQTLGTPTEKTWPGVTELIEYKTIQVMYKVKSKKYFSKIPGLSRLTKKLLNQCFILNPVDRPKASEVLKLIYY